MDEDHQHMENGMWTGDVRKRKSMKWQEALYGVEDSDSDYEDSAGNCKRRRRGEGKNSSKADLAKPVRFVSARTVVMPSDEIVSGEAAAEKDDPANGGVGVGLGFGAPGHAGFEFGAVPQQEEEELEFLPSAFGKRIKEGAERREMEREKGKKAAKSGPDFEMFTKGIGSKLLKKMGYNGGGLGKNQQGIAEPIEAKLRPKNMGMGFYDFRETTTGLPPPAGKLPPREEVVVEKPKSKEKLWMKKNKGKKAALRTAAELIAEKEAQNGGIFQQTILDMRGPQPCLLTNWENLNAELTAIEDDSTPMPELQHNLRLTVVMTEAEVRTCTERLQNERDTVLILNKDRERLETAVGAQGKEVAVMEAVTSSLEQIQRWAAEGGMNLENLAHAFARIQYSYPGEYKLFSIEKMALSFSLPLMSNLFNGWQPFLQPQYGVEAMTAWQELLQRKDAVFQDVDNSPYLQLVLEVVFPHVRFATTNVWQPRDPEPILTFLDAWDKVLPAVVKRMLLEGVVMPKLTVAVEEWDPQLEEVPIHTWLHPWLPWLGTRMEPLYVPIRYKLKAALVKWHPGDPSVLALLSPWKNVFDPANWELLMVSSIMPNNIQAMQEFVINPANQILDPFHWVMTWVPVVPLHHMVNLLEVHFFPKWHHVLLHWLRASPDYEEVTAWFVIWKSLLPTELLANEKVRHQLNLALKLIHRAMEGTPSVPLATRDKLNDLLAGAAKQRLVHDISLPQPARAAAAHQQPPHIVEDRSGDELLSLKEALEAFAGDHDVQFMPKPGRTHEGLQVYSFGAVSVVVDTAKRRILARTGDGWNSVCLEQVLEMHRSRGGSQWI